LLPDGSDGDINTVGTDLPGLGGFDDPLDIIEGVRIFKKKGIKVM